MTAVSSAAKMVGQLRRWLTGEESVTDGDSVENVCGQCDNCARNSAADKLQYRGRSYSDCCAVSCRGGSRDTIRERSCSVNSRWMTSQSSRRVGSRSCQTSSGTAWLSGRQRDVREVLDEDPELCRCWSGSVEPVCCCERCFVYVDEPAPVLPPPYTELMLLEHCANLAKRLTSNEPSITAVNTAAKTDQVMNTAEAAVNCTSLETCQLTLAQSNVAVSPRYLTSFLTFSVLCCGCLGGAAVQRLTCDQNVTGSTPSWGAIKSTRSTQPSIPPR